MKIHEFQAKELLAKYGAMIPENAGVVDSPQIAVNAVKELGGRGVLKAQVYTGGRGKAGGIRVANTPEEARTLAGEMLGMKLVTKQAPQGVLVEKLLVEEPLVFTHEFYMAFLPDRAAQRNTLIVSKMGGMDIEAVAEEHPEAISRVTVDPAVGLRDYQIREALYNAGFPTELFSKLGDFIHKLYTLYIESDASLVEINPLALTDDKRLVAADAKIQIDDNALMRHPEFAAWQVQSEEDPIEAEAHRRGIQSVRLGGEIGIIGNGAGLVMATLDEVSRAGGKPANFLDIGGGARAELVRNSLEIVLMDPNVRAVLFNIFGGITRCDEVAQGIIEATETMELKVPLVVRLSGTRAEEGAELLKGTKITPVKTMNEAAREVVRASIN